MDVAVQKHEEEDNAMCSIYLLFIFLFYLFIYFFIFSSFFILKVCVCFRLFWALYALYELYALYVLYGHFTTLANVALWTHGEDLQYNAMWAMFFCLCVFSDWSMCSTFVLCRMNIWPVCVVCAFFYPSVRLTNGPEQKHREKRIALFVCWATKYRSRACCTLLYCTCGTVCMCCMHCMRCMRRARSVNTPDQRRAAFWRGVGTTIHRLVSYRIVGGADYTAVPCCVVCVVCALPSSRAMQNTMKRWMLKSVLKPYYYHKKTAVWFFLWRTAVDRSIREHWAVTDITCCRTTVLGSINNSIFSCTSTLGETHPWNHNK